MPAFIILVAAAAASAAPLPANPTQSDARTVIEAQLNSPPRTGPEGGMTADEAAVVKLRYLQSIGKRIEQDKGNRTQGGQAQ